MNERHRKKRLEALRYVVAMPRSLWYNLRLFPLRQAIRMPLLISNRTAFDNIGGKVIIECDEVRMGMIKVGFATFQGSNYLCESTRLNIRGKVIVRGECALGVGSSVEVAEGGVLTLGPRFHLGPRSLLVCHKSMSFGRYNRISWCCTLMDTDQHALVDEEGTRVNPDRPILFGDNVWVGCHVIVPKGVQLSDNTTVAAGSRLVGRYEEPMVVLAGNPAAVVRRGVKREQ